MSDEKEELERKQVLEKMSTLKMVCNDSGSIRFNRPPFIDGSFNDEAVLATGHFRDCLRVMQPLHKTNLLAHNATFRDRGYLNRSDEQAVVAIFRRYKSDLEQAFGDIEASDGQPWMVIFMEQFRLADDLEATALKALEVFRKVSTGNFKVVPRFPAKAS